MSPIEEPSPQRGGDAPLRRGIFAQLPPAAVFMAFFAYVYFDTRDLPRNAGQFTATMALVGMALGLAYLVVIFVPVLRSEGDGGLEGTPAPLTFDERFRTARTYAWIAVLIFGVWALNFHIAIPLFLVVYLWGHAGVRRWWVLGIVTIASLLLVTIFYGDIIRTTWPNSLIEQIFDFDMQRVLMRLLPL